MTSPLATAAHPFGRVLTAMVTPFDADGVLDLDAARAVARFLVDGGSDGLVLTGTTGESPTVTDAEAERLWAAVLETVGDRATVLAGVGTNDTAHSVVLAGTAARVGVHGLLIVTPYYSRPPQHGIVAHTDAVATAADALPVMMYDIPVRTGVTIAEETYPMLQKVAPVVAVKDAVGDLERGAWLMRETQLAWYSGDDSLNLAWLAVGASGMVSVLAHAAPAIYAEMVRAVDSGDLTTARALNDRMLPVVRAMMTHTQGAITSKAALQLLGVLEQRTMRSPLPEATDAEIEIVRDGLAAATLL